MTDSFASGYVYQLRHGPALAPKKVIQTWEHGEVRIIVPADPEKIKELHKKKRTQMRRRRAAGLPETNDSTWGTR